MKLRRKPGGTVFFVALLVGLLGLVGVARQRHAREVEAINARLLAVATGLAAELTPLLASPALEVSAADAAVRRWAVASMFRVTLIDGQGRVLADSWTTPELLDRLENHGARPEIVAARAKGVGTARRRSSTTDRPMLYAAVAVGPSGSTQGFVRAAAEEGELAFPWFAALVIVLCAGSAAAVAQAWDHAAYRRVARHLLPWSDLPSGADLEILAEDADRHFRSQREEAERAQQAMRAALAEVSEGVVLIDREARLRFANPAAEKLLGARLASGRKLVEAVRAPELMGAVHDTLETSTATFTTCAGADGAELAVRICPLAHPVLVAALVLRDVRGERQLERARRALVADLAHELRTPLTVLAGLAEELAEEPALAELATALTRQVKRLTAFAEDLEELATIESGQVRLHLEQVDLAAVARQVAEDLSPEANAAGVTLSVGGEGVWLESDAVRVAQVLTNLVSNGIRFNRRGGEVTVTVSAEGGDAVVTVKDTGVGIPEREIPLVFQRFYRVRRDEQSSGSGLGLAIVKHLVKVLGGSVHLSSQEDVGTTVTVRFPRADVSTTAEAPPPPAH